MADNTLPKSGVRLVADNADGFLGALKRASQGLDSFTARTEQAAQASESTSSRIVSSFQRVGEIAIGNALAPALQQIAGGFVQATTAGLRFNSETENVAGTLNSFTKDAGITANILAFLRKEADQTPFPFRDLANATTSLIPLVGQTNMSFRELLSTTELLAAIRPEQGIDGAIYALREAAGGQFESLIDRFDIPRQLINKLKAEGVPNIEIVGRALQELGYDASLVSNLSQTLTGRWSTFLDTINGVAARLSAPLFDVLKQGLADLQGFFDTNKATINAWADFIGRAIAQAATMAGQVLTNAAQRLAGVWNSAMTSLEGGTARSIGRVAGILAGVAKLAVSWGTNIITSLAVGIRAAIGAVVQALQFLGGIIRGLLQPGSPPKLLPDLDKWGTGAADAYLEGWTKADFGALQEMGRIISGIVQSGFKADDPRTIPTTLNTQKAVAAALGEFRQTGTVGAAAFDRIRAAAGSAGAQVAELVRRQIDLLSAQSKLAKVTDEYDKRLGPLYDKLRGIQDAQTVEDEEERLKEIEQLQNSIFTSAEDKRKLAREAEEIKLKRQIRGLERQRDTAVDGAQEEVDAAQAALDQFKSRLEIEQDTLALQRQQVELLKRLKELAEGLGDAFKALKEEQEQSPLEKQLEINRLLSDELDAQTRLAEIDKELAKDNIPLQKRKSLELEKQRILLERQQRLARGTELGIAEQLKAISETPIDLSELEKASKGAKGLGDELANLGTMGGSLDWLKEEFGSGLAAVSDLDTGLTDFKTIFDEVRLGFQEGQGQIQGFLDRWTETKETVSASLAPIAGIVTALGAFGILTTVAGWIGGATAAFGGLTGAIAAAGGVIPLIVGLLGGPVTITIGLVSAALGLLAAAWIGNWGGIRDTLTSVWTQYLWPTLEALRAFIANSVIPATKDVYNWLAPKFAEAGQILSDTWTTVLYPAVNALYEFTRDYLVPLTAAFVKVLQEVARIGFEAIRAAWNTFFWPLIERFYNWLNQNVNPETDKWTEALGRVAAIIRDTLSGILKSLLQDRIKPFAEGVDKIKNAVKRLIEWLEKLIETLARIDIPPVLTPGSPTPFEIGLWGISSAAKQVNDDLSNMTGLFGDLNKTVVSPTVNPSSATIKPPATAAQMAMGATAGNTYVKQYNLNQQVVDARTAANSSRNFALFETVG